MRSERNLVYVAYGALKKYQYVENQEQFSVKFLHKSPRYYSMIKASPSKNFSLDSMVALAVNLERLADSLVRSRISDVRLRAICLQDLGLIVRHNVFNYISMKSSR